MRGKEKMKEISTKNLDRVLSHAKPSDIEAYLSENRGNLHEEEWPFGRYMKERFREKA